MNKKIIIATLLAVAAFSANAQFLFRVSGNGLEKPSYILGSVHILSGELLDSIPVFLEAENQCQQLYVETNFRNALSREALHTVGRQLMNLPDSMTISDVMGEERMSVLQERMKESCHVDLADSAQQAYLHYQPFVFTSLLTTMISYEALTKYPAMRNGKLMDGICIQRAEARGWKVGELDRALTPDEQAKAKEKLTQSLEEQADTLMALLNHFEERKEKILKQFEGAVKVFDYWTSGDYESFEADVVPEAEANPAVFGDRNKKWLPTIIAAMKEMPTLFVFGAGHLLGSQGVMNLLREAGYLVEPVK